ncbi:MAG: PAS domain-containing protein, partial [Hyphomicrobiales bacterium]|nr:PAS domain-containing protein [Hyphomicrobiales bacterium]
MKLAATRELFAYWTSLRAARSAPERNDVDPGALRGILA